MGIPYRSLRWRAELRAADLSTARPPTRQARACACSFKLDQLPRGIKVTLHPVTLVIGFP